MWSYIDVSIVFGSCIATTAINRMRFNKSLLSKKLFFCFAFCFLFYFILLFYFIFCFILFYFVFCFLFYFILFCFLFFWFFFRWGGGELVSQAVMVEVLWILMCKPKECFRWNINLIFVAPWRWIISVILSRNNIVWEWAADQLDTWMQVLIANTDNWSFICLVSRKKITFS